MRLSRPADARQAVEHPGGLGSLGKHLPLIGLAGASIECLPSFGMWLTLTRCDFRLRQAAGRLVAATLAGAVGVIVFAGPPGQPPQPGDDAAGPMWVRTFPLDESRHVLLIVDPIQHHVAIYHVDAVAGTLTLKSSRDISGDLRLGDFNAQEPKPATLRKMLEMNLPAASPRPNR